MLVITDDVISETTLHAFHPPTHSSQILLLSQVSHDFLQLSNAARKMECGVIKNCDFRRTVILLFVLAGLTFMVTYNYVCFKVQPAIIFYTADKREALDHITTVNKQAATSGLKLDIEEDSPERVCDDPFCRDHLTVYEKRLYTECEGKVQKLAHGMMSKDNGCRFLVTKSRKPVALISFPGSGNTWVRQLLEQASGICTGSAMCDMSLRYSGFTGENINTGSTLVVKTHRPKPSWLFGAANYASRIEPKSSDAVYESAIIIVRNPMNAMVSEWNRIVANDFLRKTIRLHAHTKKVGKENFSKFKGYSSLCTS